MLGAGDSDENATCGTPTPKDCKSPMQGAHKGLEYCNTEGQALLWARGAEDGGNRDQTQTQNSLLTLYEGLFPHCDA